MRSPFRLILVAVAVAAFELTGCSSAAGPRIDLVKGPGPDGDAAGVIEVRGLDAAYLASPEAAALDWSTAFQVFVDGGAGPARPDAPAVLGATSLDGGVVRFTPRYPLQAGLRYRGRLHAGPWRGPSGAGGGDIDAVFMLEPKRLEPKTVVEHVYPSTSVLPENQLKFYVHFSGPMRRGQAYRRIHLVESTGRVVEAPFLEIGEELWDPGGTRFTLFFDPGRIKRGVKPHEDVGPCLEAGKSYALVIDGDWLDEDGAPLREGFRKEFHVVKPDYDPPNPLLWKVTRPQAGSRSPLVIVFPEPLDHALLERLLRVRGPGGEEIAGETRVGLEEREWRFEPAAPWAEGSHEIVFEKILEDLAGNSVGRPFEVDVERSMESRVAQEFAVVPVEIRRAEESK